MTFIPIDIEKWERKEHYQYYINIVKAKYTITMEIDITTLLQKIKEKKTPFLSCFFIYHYALH